MGDSTPKSYRTRYIQPGLISYEDEGRGIYLVGQEALDKMRKSFIGMPVYNMVHKDIDAEDAFSSSSQITPESADGIISDTWKGDDGWEWANMLIWDPETKKNIDQHGFLVSCAYCPTKEGPGGKSNGIDYDGEVIDANYEHMAVVANPRYEDSKIFANSKGAKMAKFKLSDILPGKKSTKEKMKNQKAVPPETEEKKEDEQMENTGGAFVNVGGENVPMSELMAAYQEKMNGAEEEFPMMNMEDEVEMSDGSMVKVSDMVNAYQEKMGGMANAEPPTDTVAEPVVKMQNAKPEKNENFKSLQNAASAASKASPKYMTQRERIAAGKLRYGSPQKTEV